MFFWNLCFVLHLWTSSGKNVSSERTVCNDVVLSNQSINSTRFPELSLNIKVMMGRSLRPIAFHAHLQETSEWVKVNINSYDFQEIRAAFLVWLIERGRERQGVDTGVQREAARYRTFMLYLLGGQYNLRLSCCMWLLCLTLTLMMTLKLVVDCSFSDKDVWTRFQIWVRA